MIDVLSAARPRRLKELSPPLVRRILDADPRVLVPVGTCEQHAPTLPFGTATLIAERLADDLSALTGVLRAPTVEYGVTMPHHGEEPGIAGMRKKTLHRLLNDLLCAWEACGVLEFVLITAHSHDPHTEAMATVVTGGARVRVVDIAAVRIDDLLEGTVDRRVERDTSLLLHLAPTLVQPVVAPNDTAGDTALHAAERTGAAPGTPEKGRLIYERLVSRVAERVLGVTSPAA